MDTSKKLLLTTVCSPLGEDYGDSKSVGYELLHEQVTRAQGIFSPRTVIHHFSLEYIAHNIEMPTMVLQYPDEKTFIQEIKKNYDYVGISFVLSTFHHLKRMSALVRKYAPNSKIILGGYGTVLTDDELSPYGDLICREEGVKYLRRIFNEPELPMPYDHPVITNRLKIFSLPMGNNGMVFGGLGCPNGCDFCCTSYFFKRKHIRLLPEGDDLFHVIEKYRAVDPRIKFTVLDEDFLLNQKRARRFLELVREKGEEPPSLFVFSSIKALSQYQMSELLEMGISGVWIGYEGKRSGYEKQQGRKVEELFKDLRDHGIHILASMVIGFDYQTPEIIRQEQRELLDLKPTFTQTLIYGPTPGTPFYDRIQKEHRLSEELSKDRETYYKRCTGFYGMIHHPSLSSQDLERIQKTCFETDFKVLGPSILRAIESWFLGYQSLAKSTNKLLQKRAEMYKKDILESLPIFLSAQLFAPSKEVKEHVAKLYREITSQLKIVDWTHTAKSWIMVVMALWTSLCLKMKWFQNPHVTKLAYRMKSSEKNYSAHH